MEEVERFATGDLDAFEALFRQYQGKVYGWIVRIVREPAAAEDLTVETFWNAHRAYSRFDPKRSFGAWLRRIANNLAFDYLRKRRKRKEVPVLENEPETPPRDAVVEGEQREFIRRAFESLPAKLQAVAALSLIEGMAYAEVGAALGISAAAAKSREFRAVRLLRKKLRRLGVEP